MPPVSVVSAGLPRVMAVFDRYTDAAGSVGRAPSTTMWSRPKASAIPLPASATFGSPVVIQYAVGPQRFVAVAAMQVDDVRGARDDLARDDVRDALRQRAVGFARETRG